MTTRRLSAALALVAAIAIAPDASAQAAGAPKKFTLENGLEVIVMEDHRMPVVNWSQFPEALRRKLLLELAGRPLPQPPNRTDSSEPILVLARAEPVYDCSIGEKLWQQDRKRQRIYDP